ncbi:hypothetical protein TCAL_14686 [Tigriopus californicus]|uniref:Uncharacterized protein n=1 Tax=Tigriopus californicus TaxID=6832 RepID=A0A553NQH3_TIGCA|nr:hypothetical protein TCAL_14686 [Tigriopus californicus]
MADEDVRPIGLDQPDLALPTRSTSAGGIDPTIRKSMSSKKRMLTLQINAIRARLGDHLKTSRTRIKLDLEAVEKTLGSLQAVLQEYMDNGLDEEVQDQITAYLFTEEQRVRDLQADVSDHLDGRLDEPPSICGSEDGDNIGRVMSGGEINPPPAPRRTNTEVEGVGSTLGEIIGRTNRQDFWATSSATNATEVGGVVLLGIIAVTLEGPRGQIVVNALIDEGSDTSFMSERVLKRLGGQKRKEKPMFVHGAVGSSTIKSGNYNLKILYADKSGGLDLNMKVIPKVCGTLKGNDWAQLKGHWKHL